MSDTIPTQYGSCIRTEWVFRDEEGNVEDISADTFEIREAEPASLADDFVITALEPAAGRIEIFLDNRFRLCRLLASGCEDNCNLVWIEVE